MNEKPPNPNFLKTFRWNDEAQLNGENPCKVRESSHQHQFSVNMRAAMTDDKLMDPVAQPARLSLEHYLIFYVKI